MEFKQFKEKKEQLFFPCVWKDAQSNPEHFVDDKRKVVSFDSVVKCTSFLKKECPLLCRIGIKKFPKVGYVKAVSKNDYHILS